MTQTPDSPSAFAVQAADQVESLSRRLADLLGFVPDDRLAWTPSPTSRSALRLAAHAALTNRFFADVLSDRLPEPPPTPEAFFAALHAAERAAASREAVRDDLERSTAELAGVLRALDAERADAPCRTPFGPIPARFWVGQAVEHLAYHGGQLAYLQTVWGDLDDHMG